ncbi:BRO family protein [Mesotoga sp.]|uniref:BRO family protein n=1 Tax=Mesotoga sp. TaxID=2053577 RepID=UPI00345ECACD
MDNRHEIAVFENDELGKVRVFTRGDEPWFAAKDVTAILGYTNASKAITDHVDEEDKLNNESLSSLGQRGGWLINESGLYALILSSKLPTARKFKRWVTSEVLPSIRRHSAYLTDELLDRIEADKEIVSDITAKMVAERRSHEQTRKALSDALPKVEYFDAFVDMRDCTNIRATAKELEIPERIFCKFLMDKKLVYRAPSKNLMPYQKPFNAGFFIVRDYCRHNHKGCYTLFTAKGKDYIRRLWARENSKCA